MAHEMRRGSGKSVTHEFRPSVYASVYQTLHAHRLINSWKLASEENGLGAARGTLGRRLGDAWLTGARASGLAYGGLDTVQRQMHVIPELFNIPSVIPVIGDDNGGGD